LIFGLALFIIGIIFIYLIGYINKWWKWYSLLFHCLLLLFHSFYL
jgi:hypothetical protein